MDHIRSCIESSIFKFIFRSVYKDCHFRSVKHILENIPYRMSRTRTNFICFDIYVMLIMKMVLQISPILTTTVTDEKLSAYVLELVAALVVMNLQDLLQKCQKLFQ